MKFRIAGIIFVGIAAVAWANTAASQHADYYVLDGFGGVHAGGGAPTVSPAPPYFGFDIARAIEYVAVGTGAATGNGLLVLDGFGGVHSAGALASDPPSGPTPYFGFDIVRGLTLRNVPPRGAGNTESLSGGVSSTTFVVLSTTTIRAPDDGFLLVIGSANSFCNGSGDSAAELNMNVDSTSADSSLTNYYVSFPDCSITGGTLTPNENIAITKLYPVAAGAHTVNLLGRKVGGTQDPLFDAKSIVALFVDRDALGASSVDTSPASYPEPIDRRGR